MMKILEEIYVKLGTFSLNLVNTFFSFLKIILQTDFTLKFPQGVGRQCIILGNGPSLADSLKNDLDFFKKHPLICVNSFPLSKEFSLLQPEYCVMHDPGLWSTDNELPKRIFSQLVLKTTWPLTLFVPRRAAHYPYIKEYVTGNSNISIVYYNYSIYRGFRALRTWLFKHNLAMPQAQNVLVACLFLAINLKFKEIFVFGADHTWHENLYVDTNNTLCIKDVHYYDNKDEDVAIKPYYRALDSKDTFKVHEVFEAWSKVFKGYFTIQEYAKDRGVKIYNSSTVSFIDAFERIKI